MAVSDQVNAYAPPVAPEFRSTIPSHLIERLTDSEQHMIATLSKQEAHIAWTDTTVAALYQHAIRFDARIKELEAKQAQSDRQSQALATTIERTDKLWDWKQYLSGKWALAWALFILLVPIAIKYVIDWLAAHVKL